MVHTQLGSEMQSKYFGKFNSWRPYLMIKINAKIPVTDNLIRNIIEFSKEKRKIKGISYKRYFRLRDNETFEFRYGPVRHSWNLKRLYSTKFKIIKI